MDNKSDCNEEIKALIAERMEKGKKAYGHGLMQNSGYDWVQEALEEALDLSIYLSAKLIEIKTSQPQVHREAVAPAVERS